MPSDIASARNANSLLLSKGVTRLEGTLKLTTAILALAAGVYTYLGVRELLNGSPTTVFFAAVIYSVAVSVGIYAFWIFLMQFMPHVVARTGRALMFGCMLLGSLMIVAMSSWLNASALAGAAAIQQHLAITVQNSTRDLDTANTNAIAAQGLLPDIQLASSRFAKLADAERAGSLTGTAGYAGELSGLHVVHVIADVRRGALVAEDIADCIAWTVTRPHHVNIDLMVVRPLAQAAQHKVARESGAPRC